MLCLVCILCSSCNRSDDDSGPEQADFIILKDSAIQISENDAGTWVDVVAGTNTVFKYEFNEPGDVHIADSGYSKYLYFEVDNPNKDFSLSAEQFQNAKVYLRHSCFCIFTDYYPADSGFINAQKLQNDQWKISFEVEAHIEGEAEEVITLNVGDSGIFRPE